SNGHALRRNTNSSSPNTTRVQMTRPPSTESGPAAPAPPPLRAPWGAPRATALAAWRPLERDLPLHDERDHGGEQRHPLHERRRDDHGGLNAGAVLRLARHAFDGLTADPPDAYPGAEHREAGGEAGTDERVPLTGGGGRGGFLQQREQVQQHVTLPY